jgi:glycerol-3-phosphate dehydrogenase subunit C
MRGSVRFPRATSRSRRRSPTSPAASRGFHDPEGEAAGTVKVLEANGIEVVVPEQRCCGIALVTMGAEKAIRADAERNIATLLPLVDRGFTVVASAPSCGLALIEDYPRILGTEEARRLADHTIDIHQYLWRLYLRGELRTDFRHVPISVVYHNACHSIAQGITEEPIGCSSSCPASTSVPSMIPAAASPAPTACAPRTTTARKPSAIRCSEKSTAPRPKPSSPDAARVIFR